MTSHQRDAGLDGGSGFPLYHSHQGRVSQSMPQMPHPHSYSTQRSRCAPVSACELLCPLLSQGALHRRCTPCAGLDCIGPQDLPSKPCRRACTIRGHSWSCGFPREGDDPYLVPPSHPLPQSPRILGGSKMPQQRAPSSRTAALSRYLRAVGSLQPSYSHTPSTSLLGSSPHS